MKQAFEPGNVNIQSLSDRFEISNLLLDLAAAIDTDDKAALNHIFTANAIVKDPLPEITRGQHQISNANIHIDGDTASAKTLCHCPGRPTVKYFYYVDSLQRTDQGWRIIKRVNLSLAQ